MSGLSRTTSRQSRRLLGIPPLKRALLAVILPVILFAIWWIASAGSENFFLPPLSEIMAAFAPTWLDGRFNADIIPSLTRLATGYLSAFVVGVTLGILIGLSRPLRLLTGPVFEFFRAIPPPVLIPILILIFGIGDTMKVFVIALACLWPILLNTIDGVRGVDGVLLDTSRSYRLDRMARLTIYLRAASPRIAAGGRQALALGVILMVISEMFASTDGIGFAIVQFQRNFAIPQSWTGVILLGLIGIALSTIYTWLERLSLAWYRGYKQSELGGKF